MSSTFESARFSGSGTMKPRWAVPPGGPDLGEACPPKANGVDPFGRFDKLTAGRLKVEPCKTPTLGMNRTRRDPNGVCV